MRFWLLIFFLIELVLVLALVATPDVVLAQGSVVKLINPLAWIGVNNPEQLVVRAFQGFAAIIASIAIAFTVFSGFKLILASTEEAIETARKSVTWAVGGFIVSLLSFTLISGTAKFLGFDLAKVPTDGNRLTSPLVLSGSLDKTEFVDVMNFVMQNFLGILGFASTLMIIYYGYRYLTSLGNEEAIEKAKTGLRWTILGLIVTLLSYSIIAIVQSALLVGAPTK